MMLMLQTLSVLIATRWGRGDVNLHAQDALLADVLDAAFEDVGGVLNLVAFETNTQGFRESRASEPDDDNASIRHPQFSMMVATGKGKVALIETGRMKIDNNDEFVFSPTKEFSTTDVESDGDPTVFVFDSQDDTGQVLGELGDITTVEVSRLPLNATNKTHGFMFVGGTNGVAVLTQTDGNGWDTNIGKGLDRLRPGVGSSDFPAGAKWKFLRIMKKVTNATTNVETAENIFTNVRKIVSDQNKYVYILTDTELWRVDMTEMVTPTSGTPEPIFTVAKNDATRTQVRINVADGRKNTGLVKVATTAQVNVNEFFDIMVVKRDANDDILLLGSDKGLFVNASGSLKDTLQAQDFGSIAWNAVTFGPTTAPSMLSHILDLDFKSTTSGERLVPNMAGDVFTAEGNVHALALQESPVGSGDGILAQYRFNVTGGEIKPFEEVYESSSGTKTDFFYKVGDLDGKIADFAFNGQQDFVPQAKHVVNSSSGFAERVPVTPSPDKFLADNTGKFNEIDLGVDVRLPLFLGSVVHDDASGAQSVSGGFGVRVNE